MNRRLQIGEKIGDYQILGFLGAGGMGEVYQGVHTRINRLAAIKILSNYSNNPTFITRFFNEARLQSSLHHPNIATLYDFQEINRQLYIFMEYADGERLEDLIARRAFAVEDALRTFESVCQAIAFIHQNGIIHRDIKAQNIKLTLDGTVKLLDFGIAKDSLSQRLTKVGGVIGTPSYFAPEQLAGKEAGQQTDIWALGILFYEMLTGGEPFKADTFGALHAQISSGRIESPEKINPAVTREISHIVVKCLEKKPEDRYRAVDEILADVQRILRGEKATSRFSFKKLQMPSSKAMIEKSAGGDSPNQSSTHDLRKSGFYSPVKLSYALVSFLAAAAVLAVFSIAGLSIWSFSGSNPKPLVTENSSIPKPILSGNSKIAIVQPISKANLSRVRIEINEGSAQIFRDGQSVGKTPYELEGREGETINITLKREGFEDKTERVDIISRRPIYTFSLKSKK